MKRFVSFVLLLLCCSGLAAGCGPKSMPDRVYRPSFEDPYLKKLVEKYEDPATVELLVQGEMCKAQRNTHINELLYMADIAFYNFKASLATVKAWFDTSSDFAVLGLNVAGTVTPGSYVKTLLAALSGGVTGTSLAVDQNVFQEQSIHAIVSVMEANRAKLLVGIRKRMELNEEDYSFGHAMIDVTRYNDAGSITNALSSILKDAGNKAEEKEDELAVYYANYAETKRVQEQLSEIKTLLTDGTDDDRQVQNLIAWIKKAKKMQATDLATSMSILLALNPTSIDLNEALKAIMAEPAK